MGYVRTGLGAVWVTTDIASPGVTPTPDSFTIPSYCDWMPFSDYLEACKPPTQAQLTAMQQAQLAKIAAIDPAAAAASVAAGNAAAVAYCQHNPADCAAYTAAPQEGSTAGAVTAYDVNQTLAGAGLPTLPTIPGLSSGMLLVGLAILGGLVLFAMEGRR